MKSKRINTKKAALAVIAILYLATWVWGIPAAHTIITRHVIRSYKTALKRFPEYVFERHPYIRFGASYAVLPCVMVNHYEYQ